MRYYLLARDNLLIYSVQALNIHAYFWREHRCKKNKAYGQAHLESHLTWYVSVVVKTGAVLTCFCRYSNAK